MDKILQFNPKAPSANIQSKIMHMMNKTEYDHLFANSNVRNKGRLLSPRADWASGYLIALPLPYLGLTPATTPLPACRPVSARLEACRTVRCPKCHLHVMDPYGDHV